MRQLAQDKQFRTWHSLMWAQNVSFLQDFNFHKIKHQNIRVTKKDRD